MPRGGRGQRGDVPAAPLREAFVASRMTYSEVARRVGWVGPRNADTARVKRVLGLCSQPRPTGVPLAEKKMSYENAVRLADALGLDYTEAGV